MKSARIHWIDLMKLVAIFLMTWGHCVHHMGLSEDEYYLLKNSGWMYSFHMPLFMILSGFVSYKIFEGEANIRRRFEQLVVPCFVIFSLQVVVPDTNNLWYLKSLFVCYVIWSFIYKLICKYGLIRTSCAFLLGCFILFPVLAYVPIIRSWKVDFMLPFFGIGILCHYKLDYIRNNLLKLTIFSFVIFVVLLALYEPDWIWYSSRPQWINLLYFSSELKILIKNGNINLSEVLSIMDLRNISEKLQFKSLVYYFSRFFIGIFGSIFFICLGIYTEKKLGNKVEKISKWGGGILFMCIYCKICCLLYLIE